MSFWKFKSRTPGANVSDFERAYLSEAYTNWVHISKICANLAIILVFFGFTIDYSLYPQHFWEFFWLRILCSLIILLLRGLYKYVSSGFWIKTITFGWMFSIQLMISYMIIRTDGANSPYYAGMNLVILGLGIGLPAVLRDEVIVSLGSIGMYVSAMSLHGFENLKYHILYNNFFFMVCTGLMASLAVYVNEKARRNEFRLKYELDIKNRELAELDRLKSNFFANISHELRTPLTLVLSPLQDLLQSSERLSDRVAGAIAISRNNALRLLKLVNDLLDVIRLEEGKGALDHRPVVLPALVRGVIDSTLHLAEARDVELIKKLPATKWMVAGDSGALEKIFFNLLSNSLKFTPSGGAITVDCHCIDEWVQVDVSDTGIGIGESDLVYIFDRFRQVDSSSTRRYAGTGLGLALVKELTEAQGGEVRASSRLGEGTTMSVAFPLFDGHQASMSAVGIEQPDVGHTIVDFGTAEQIATLPLAEVDQNADALNMSATDGRPLVLVVDDEPDMRRYLVEMLSEEYRVLQALDGQHALELIRARRPDLVVLDLMLPELDGLAVCHLVKSDAATSAVKLILLTARVDETAKLKALDEGADDFLTKPFSSVEVRTRLRNLLRTAQLETDLRQQNDSLERTLVELRRTEAQLVQSEKLNALGSLAAGLLHEVNNPLNYAMTALQVARHDPDVARSEDLREIFGDIDEGMQRIRGIVSDLRAFAYPDKDEHRVFVFADALNSAQQFTAHELRGIGIEREVSQTDEVVGSRNHVVQVLVNLFSNAAKAISAAPDQRAGLVRIVTHIADARLKISVSDNGVGMSEEVRSRIFDPFYTTADVGEGMGLGLSICYTIIQNHGGTLAARSTSGEGTEFSFDLKLAARQ